MKKILMVMATSFLFYSCATFGNFPNLIQDKSTQEDVRIIMGEPSSIRYDGGYEVWQYQFNKKNAELKDKTQINLNLDITFKEKVVDNYNLSVSKETVKEVQKEEMQKGSPLPPSQSPSQPGMREKGNFIKELDRDNDGRVSRSEFPGPEDMFNNFDKNKDGYINDNEAPQGQESTHKPMPQGGKRRF